LRFGWRQTPAPEPALAAFLQVVGSGAGEFAA
jgi:hypothetical protein